MACEVISGFNNNSACDSQAGVKQWYVASTANIVSMAVTAGAVTAVTMVATKKFYAITLDMQQSFFNDQAIGSRENASYAREQSATMKLAGNTASDIVALEDMGRGRVTLIAALQDGTYEVLGVKNGMKMLENRTSGQAMEDFNGNELVFSGKEPSKAPKIAIGVITPLL